jgi:plastocyanin
MQNRADGVLFSEATTSIILGMKIRLAVPAIVAGALALAACGGGGSDSGGTTPLPADADVVVKAVDPLSWDKKEYTATAGTVVFAVENDSSQPHNLRIVDPSDTQLPGALDIPSRGDVASESVTLTAGSYTLICTVPGHTNMRSTLTVS